MLDRCLDYNGYLLLVRVFLEQLLTVETVFNLVRASAIFIFEKINHSNIMRRSENLASRMHIICPFKQLVHTSESYAPFA